MRLGALAFLAGIFLLQQLGQLPDWRWCAVLLLLIPIAWRWKYAQLPVWFACGFFWALLRAQLALGQGELLAAYEGVDLLAVGTVASLPARTERDVRFLFDIEQLTRNDRDVVSPGRVRLSWRDAGDDVRVGDHWRLNVRLKRPHGFMNPGGFDYEAWLYQQGIRATGYVRAAQSKSSDDGDKATTPSSQTANALLSRPIYARFLDRWRQSLAERIEATLRDEQHRAIVAALAIGITQGFTEHQWDVLNRTGTTHIISISGLHVGFIAGVAFFLTRRLWARSGVTALWWPAPKAAAVAGLLAAFVYAALAGFSVPTQRSLLMIGVVMSAVIAQRHVRPSVVLAQALLAVLLLDPLAVLQAGFWLSFGAVLVILYAMNARWNEQGWWWKWGRVQTIIAIGMLPLMLVLFQRTSIVAPLTNLVAVPWFSFVTVPLTLVGALTVSVIAPLGDVLLKLAEISVQPIWWLLEYAAATPWAQWTQHVPVTWTIAAALLGTLWMLLPRGVPGRWLGVVAIAPIVIVQPAAPKFGEYWFTLLDVGQGLAAVVRTANHVLVYDTGAKFSEQFDAGDAIIVPYLRHLGARSVDMLVLSHSDSDHIGGAPSVLQQTRVAEVLSSVALNIVPNATLCATPRAWQWDGVEFIVLYPPSIESGLRRNNDNDVSCVVQVRAPGGTALLTGDIEMPSERYLLENARARLHSDILVVPHHGSLTSSSPDFVRAIAPRYALFPVGYRNRFHFPKPAVVERYAVAGARLLESTHSGAITFRVTENGIGVPEQYRAIAQRHWSARADGSSP